MAKIPKFGAINSGSHPLVGRSIQRSENCTLEIQILGDYNDLEDAVRNKGVGEDATTLFNNSEGDSFFGFKIKTLSASREEGELGVLSASLVKTNSTNKPYHYTYSVDMIEDQRPLLRHPKYKYKDDGSNKEVFKQIRLWTDTDEGVRVRFNSDGDFAFYYYEYDESISDVVLKSVSEDDAIKYCKAVMAGIEHYNVYLPVVTRVSLYLKEPPGASQDNDTHKLSGTVEFSENIGKWDNNLDFKIQGYEDNDKQGWFKNQDQYTQNSDGTWQRTEQWTFSDSKDHKWIYQEA